MAEVDAGAAAPVVPVADAPGAQPVIAPDLPVVGQEQGQQAEQPVQPRTYTEDEHKELVAKNVETRLKKERTRMAREVREQTRAEVEAEFYRRQLEERDRPKPTDQPKGKPQRKDYEQDPDGVERYIEDMADWKLEQREAARKQETAKEHDRRHQQEQVSSMLEAITKGKAEIAADFEDVVFGDAGEGTITAPMAAAISQSKLPAKLAYYLRSNAAEAQRIADLPSTLQAFEVHQLAARLSAAPKPSSAAAPIKPNSGNAAPTSGYRPDMTPKEFRELRARQIAQRGNR